MIKKVISGGQTGADEGGLIAAKKAGIETGGWMPPGFMTEKGPKPEFAELYNIKEHERKGYAPRTEANVKDSDGTIRIANNLSSAGERCTLSAIKWYNKPHIDVGKATVSEVVEWIKENNIGVLNVAGNRESTAEGINQKTQEFLEQVFAVLEDD